MTPNRENNVLKPCPLCGSEQVKVFEYDPYDGYQGDCSSTRVRCKECGITLTDRKKKVAIAKWNRRVDK